MTRLSATVCGLLLLSALGCGQSEINATSPFVLTWTEGKCVRCKIALGLGHAQFLSRNNVWAVAVSDPVHGPDVVVHSVDGGRTWRELRRTYQYPGDPDGPPAFWFLDAARGWISWWNSADEPKQIRTRDGGQHWQGLPPQFLQRMQMVDGSRGYGKVGNEFFRTTDGGSSWTGTKMPDISFIDHLFFLTPELGWTSGTGIESSDFLVFRTANGGRDWQESRTTPSTKPADVRDLFFLDQQRGWLITWGYNDDGSYLYSTLDGGKTWTGDPDRSFQGKGEFASAVRFTSRETGFVFSVRGALLYTADGGAHWHKQALPRPIYDCQVFEGDVLCAGAGFEVLSVHPTSRPGKQE